MHEPASSHASDVRTGGSTRAAAAPGKRTLTASIQRRLTEALAATAPAAPAPPSPAAPAAPTADPFWFCEAPSIEAAAARGIDTPTTALPHHDRIAASFGRHAIDGVAAHTGAAATAAAADMGAMAFATGNHVVLGDTSLHTVAHEAAHVIQQRAGIHPRTGDDDHGDRWEQHADAVAGAVVRGDSAESLLDEVAPHGTTTTARAAGPVQRMMIDGHDSSDRHTFGRWIRKLAKKQDVVTLRRICTLLSDAGELDDALARSMAQRELDKLAPGPQEREQGVPGGLQHLPRQDWWKLFIDGSMLTGYDDEDNAMQFDNENSPGYYGAMSNAFEEHVAGSDGAQIDFATYARMHAAVTCGVLKGDRQRGFSKIGQGVPGPGVGFPMTQNEYPNPVALRELLRDGTLVLDPTRSGIDGIAPPPEPEQNEQQIMERRHATLGSSGREELGGLLGDIYGGQPDPHAFQSLLSLNQGEGGNQLVVHTRAPAEEVPGRVNDLFQDYYARIVTIGVRQDIDETERMRLKLRAVATLVRSLHVGHYFVDGNGRLNTMLLLDRLLVDLGMSPVILQTTSTFGGAYSADELVDQILEGMRAFEATLPVGPGGQ